jgi:hypothetical protein
MWFGIYQRLNVPVTATDCEVIRALYRKIRPECRRDRAFRKARHDRYRGVLKCHHNAFEVYRQYRF